MSRSSNAYAKQLETVKPSEIVASFNTWAFKREKPSDQDRLQRVVATAVMRGEPVPFVLYWGKGPRSQIGAPDLECLNYLSMLAARVQKAYRLGAAFDLVFTDTHARLNGHSEQSMARYFREVSDAADPRMFRRHMLSTLVANIDATKASSMPPDRETLERLEKCAAKWFGGEGSSKDAALNYFAMNMIERRAIENAFPESIFVTFNGSEYRSLFPDEMPIFYMYSLKKGMAVKPWFLPDVPSTVTSITRGAVATTSPVM